MHRRGGQLIICLSYKNEIKFRSVVHRHKEPINEKDGEKREKKESEDCILTYVTYKMKIVLLQDKRQTHL